MSMQARDDGVLVSQVRQGNLDAYGELVRRYQGSVFGVCYRLLGGRQEAEDLAQDAFLRGYERLETFDLAYPFGPWIRRVAANLCLNHMQRRRPAVVEFDDEAGLRVAPPGPTPETAAERRQDVQAIRQAILALPPRYRAVIELRHYQDASYEEIASTLRLSISDVKSHLFRARRMLARRLTGHD
jgi:RNA polymerase sigma-70 factor (ECF subfamily)